MAVQPVAGENDDVPLERPLVISPCQAECAWSTTSHRLGGMELFACEACGTEWVASEAWTPVDSYGVVPEAVRTERIRVSGPGSAQN